MLCNAMGVGGIRTSSPAQISVTNVYGRTLLALRGCGGVTFPEWPLRSVSFQFYSPVYVKLIQECCFICQISVTMPRM